MEFERQCQSDGTPQKPDLATHMLVLLVRGIFTRLKFPLAQFPTTGATSHQLYPVVTEAVMRLEIMGFKVISITSMCPNPYADDNRSLYFIADVPHLLKTTRNCWSNSYGYSRSRKLWVHKMMDYRACGVLYNPW